MRNDLRLQLAAIKLAKYRLPATIWLLCVATLPTLAAAVLYFPKLGLSPSCWFVGQIFSAIQFCALVCVFIGCFMLSESGYARKGRKILAIGIMVASAPYFGMVLAQSVRVQAYTAVSTRAAVLVKAIDAYERDEKRPPDSLKQLLPKYIAAIPETGIAGCPTFAYSSIGYRTRDSWELSVKYAAPMYYDLFFYGPSREYMSVFGAGYRGKIGDWMYVHE